MRYSILLTLICSAYFAVLSVGAQTVPAPLQKVTLANWLGLNTADGDLNVDPRFMRKAHNVDFSRYGLNVIGARRGSSIRMARAGIDSLTGAGAFNRLDGQRQLIFAQDSTTVGYGSLYTTRIGSDSIRNAGDTSRSPIKLVTYWSPQAPTTFTNYRDAVVASNGVQKMVVYDGNVTRTLPIAAPGELLCVPEYKPLTSDSNSYDNLNGQYRYLAIATKNSSSYDSTMFCGYISDLIPVRNGSVRITNFIYPNRDSLGLFNSGTVNVHVFRTLANKGDITGDDVFYSLPAELNFGYVSLTDSTTVATLIDTTSDAYLLANYAWTITKSTQTNFASVGFQSRIGKQHTGVLPTATSFTKRNRYGAPLMVADSFTTDSTKSIFRGLISGNQNVIYGTSYVCTFVDTTGRFVNESDTGVSTWIRAGWGATFRGVWRYRLSIPRLPAGLTGLRRRLYRQHSFYSYKDTMQWEYTRFVLNTATGVKTPIDSVPKSVRKFGDSLVLTGYHLVSEIHPDSLYFTDSAKWDSLQFAPRFRSSTPQNLANVQTINGRLYGTNGVRLFASSEESPGFFGAFDFNDFSSDQNDAVQVYWGTRDGIRVFLTNSNYLVPYNDGTPVKIGSFGSTPRSHAEGNGGHFSMTFGGQVFFEQDGTSLERTFTSAVVSEKLRNFANLSADIKNKAVGFYLPEEEKYLLNIDYGSTDTTFCWDVRAGAWSTWDLSIGHATLFDTGAVGAGIPSRTMYYVPRGTAFINRYPDTTAATGQSVTFSAITVPTLRDPFSQSQVTNIGVWGRHVAGSVFGPPSVTIYDNLGNSIGGKTNSGAITRYWNSGCAMTRPYQMVGFGLSGQSGGDKSPEVWFDGLEIEYKASASGVAR